MEVIGEVWLCLLMADFISGVGHWWEDTYSVPTWPWGLGTHVAKPNINHHLHPRDMGQTFWNRNGIQICLGIYAIAALAVSEFLTWQWSLTIAIASCSNEFHAWAHRVVRHPIIDFLQETGLIQSTEHHANHHVKPFADRFCVVTNCLNPILDRIKFWRGLEFLVSRVFGVEPKRGLKVRSFV